MKNLLQLFFLICIIIISVSCSSDSDSNNKDEELTNDEHLALLTGLGIDVNDYEPLTDPDGLPLPKDWNPLGTKYGRFDAKLELFFIGLLKGGSWSGIIDDDISRNRIIFDDPSASWNILKEKAAVAADIDGDGFDEMVTVFVKSTASSDIFFAYIVDRSASGAYAASTIQLLQTTHYSPPAYYFPQGSLELLRQKELQLSAGDFDGDNKSELLVAYGNNVYIFNDKESNFALTENKTFNNKLSIYPFSLAVGNLDKDISDEFIICYTTVNGSNILGLGKYSIFDGSINSPITGHTDQNIISITSGTKTYGFCTVTLGDFDGDKLNEIAFCGRDTADTVTNRLYVVLQDDFRTNFTHRTGFSVINKSNDDYNINGSTLYPFFSQLIKSLDYDKNPDNKDELLAGNKIVFFADLNNIDLSTDLILEYPIGNEVLPYAIDTGNFCIQPESLAREEAAGIFMYFDPSTGLQFAPSIITFAKFNDIDHYATISTDNSLYQFPIICLGDIDNDSPVVKYLDHEMRFTNPIILSTMASPPYWDNIEQNTDNMVTYFGSSYGSTSTESNHMGFSVGVTCGFEVEVSALVVKLGSFKTTATLEAKYDWTFGSSHTISSMVAYNCIAGEDRVIFSAIPYDIYYYEIISDEDPSAIGSTMCINIPLGKQILSVTRDFYNENNANLPDIDDSFYTHTIGDVSTYPNDKEMEALINAPGSNGFSTKGGVMSNGLITVPQGSGNTELGITIEDALSNGYAIDSSLTVEVEAVAAGLVVGASAGFQYGYSYDLTTVSGTSYGAVIGGIPSDYFNSQYIYSTGIFVYTGTIGDQRFPVINYWVK